MSATIKSESGLNNLSLVCKSVNIGQNGNKYVKYIQYVNNREVKGGEIIVHLDNTNKISYITGLHIDNSLYFNNSPSITSTQAKNIALNSVNLYNKVSGTPFLKYYHHNDNIYLIYEVQVIGYMSNITNSITDVVTVNINSINGNILTEISSLTPIKFRQIYNSNGTAAFPGALSRSEGQSPTTNSQVNTNYTNFGIVYDFFKQHYGLDSYNGQGATISATVNLANNIPKVGVNAAWLPTQNWFIFTLGDGTSFSNLVDALDVTAHEYTHAVTQYSSNLEYNGESGGLNEALSDIMGAACEAWHSGSVSANTWKIAESIITPSIINDALRYINDPTLDGVSIDHYSDYNNHNVHYSSGIANLAFYLMSQGGYHPSGSNSILVPSVGFNSARDLFYFANKDLFTSSTDFADAAYQTALAAWTNFGDEARVSVQAAWEAVGVTNIWSSNNSGWRLTLIGFQYFDSNNWVWSSETGWLNWTSYDTNTCGIMFWNPTNSHFIYTEPSFYPYFYDFNSSSFIHISTL